MHFTLDALVDRQKSKENGLKKKTKQIKLGFIFLLSVQSQQSALNMYKAVGFFGESRTKNSVETQDETKHTASRLTTTGSLRRSSEKKTVQQQQQQQRQHKIPVHQFSHSFLRWAVPSAGPMALFYRSIFCLSFLSYSSSFFTTCHLDRTSFNVCVWNIFFTERPM